MLGVEISERTVSRILRKLPRPPSQTWKTFLHNHLGQMVSTDFFTASLQMEEVISAPRGPWQNPYVERLIARSAQSAWTIS